MTAASVQMSGIVKKHGAVTALAGIDLEVRPGEFFSLLGPSGSGKTTTLRILAGLESATEGRVLLSGKDVTNAEPGERDVAMVFQSYALYPHMTVSENISFPLRMIHEKKEEIDKAVRDAAARVRIGHLLDRKPGQLSGGQQQRVALARAIVRKPALFLLDEPLSNLDAKLRIETRVELKRLQRALNVTAVYVTHDQEEALSLSDRLAVFMDGRIVQVGTPEEVFSKPATVEVAGFLGNPPMNLIPGSTEGFQSLKGPDVILGIRPSAVRIADAGVPATVSMVEALGEEFYADLMVGELLVRAKLREGERPAEKAQVRIHLDPSALHVFDKATGQRR
ncbi:MAG: ABC transporter ATP-binding protein [Burkholderiales bacterium]|nr:ABC transporter ATP-binding protein [Burkholderiales bacterium]